MLGGLQLKLLSRTFPSAPQQAGGVVVAAMAHMMTRSKRSKLKHTLCQAADQGSPASLADSSDDVAPKHASTQQDQQAHRQHAQTQQEGSSSPVRTRSRSKVRLPPRNIPRQPLPMVRPEDMPPPVKATPHAQHPAVVQPAPTTAATRKRAAAGGRHSKLPEAAGSRSTDAAGQRSVAGVQHNTDRHLAAATAAVQAAAAAGRQPQLRSLLVEPSWLEVLGPEFDKPYMQELESFLHKEWASQVVYPPPASVFRAFNTVPFDKVRVVILGQDPYKNEGEAMGLSFSVPPGIPVPSSLRNIYKELADDVGVSKPNHGCLQQWCQQGVLLLNAVLTLRAGLSNSHAGKGWEDFTSAALAKLVQQRSGIVFLLWGKYAQARCEKLDMSRHHVLKCAHPSGLSASRGFYGCRHFSAANEHLVEAGQAPIDWQLDDNV